MSVRSILLVSSIAALQACTTRDEAAQTETTTPAPNEVALSVADHAFQAPDSILPGWTTFRFTNRGEDVHYGHIVRLDPGKTVQELVDSYAEAIRTSGPRPTWLTRFGGPGGAVPGETSSVTQQLEPGDYVWICPVEDSAGTPHFSRGEVRPFVVRAAGVNTAAQAPPEATVVLRLTDYTFAFEPPPSAGRHVIRVENTGTEPHDVALFRLAPGITLNDMRNSLDPERKRRDDQPSEAGPPLDSLGSGAGGIAAIAPGMRAFFEADLAPGEYALVCFVTAPDGRSHIEHGMIRQFTIAEAGPVPNGRE